MTVNQDPGQELLELLFVALDHGVSSVDNGAGPLIPFIISEKNGNRSLARFVTERLEDGVAQARKEARRILSEVDRVAVAWDGFLRTNDGQRTDAIIVAASENVAGPTFIFGQRYQVVLVQRRM